MSARATRLLNRGLLVAIVALLAWLVLTIPTRPPDQAPAGTQAPGAPAPASGPPVAAVAPGSALAVPVAGVAPSLSLGKRRDSSSPSSSRPSS